MKKTKEIESSQKKKLLGKLLMIVGVMGIIYSVIEPLFVIKGCFGYGIIDILIYAVPIAALIIGYRIYSKHE